MKEETKRPEAKDDSQDEGKAMPRKAAPADDEPAAGEVEAYGDPTQNFAEPTDASGGGK